MWASRCCLWESVPRRRRFGLENNLSMAGRIDAVGRNIPCEHVTIMPLFGAMSTPVTVLSCPLSSSARVKRLADFL